MAKFDWNLLTDDLYTTADIAEVTGVSYAVAYDRMRIIYPSVRLKGGKGRTVVWIVNNYEKYMGLCDRNISKAYYIEKGLPVPRNVAIPPKPPKGWPADSDYWK